MDARCARIARVPNPSSPAIGERRLPRSDRVAPVSNPCLLQQHLRIYLEDTDAGGIVYHASWLRFFERARTDWLRTLGIEQSRLAPAADLSFVVKDMQIDFISPGRLDQRIRTELRLLESRRASLRLDQRALSEESGALLVEAQVRIAAIRLSDGRPRALPDRLIEQATATLSQPTSN